MNWLKLTSGIVVAVTVHSQAFARSYDTNFNTVTDEVAKKCDLEEGTCQSKYTAEIFKDLKFLGMPNYKKLKAAAVEQAQIWGDTILEGDYASIGKTQLDKVVVIKERKKIVLYYITYSERAIDTSSDECTYDEEKEKWIVSTCTKGRIVESVAVSPDFKYISILDDSYAEFNED